MKEIGKKIRQEEIREIIGRKKIEGKRKRKKQLHTGETAALLSVMANTVSSIFLQGDSI